MKLKLGLVMMAWLGGLLFAQEETIEDVYNRQAMRVAAMQAIANSQDLEHKKIALQDLEDMVNAGEVDPTDTAMMGVIKSLSAEGVTKKVIERGQLINNFPEVRREAARLMGEIGGDISRESLVEIVLTDPEPMVVAEAMVALSKVGDSNGEVTRALTDAMRRENASSRDNNLANAYVISIKRIVEDMGKISDVAVYDELAKISDQRTGYITVVRERAFQLLRDLQQY